MAENSPMIMAASGTTQGTAPVISSSLTIFNSISPGAGAGLSGVLPMQRIANRATNQLLVYPPINAQIESIGFNLPWIIPPGGDFTFIMASNTQFYALAPIS